MSENTPAITEIPGTPAPLDPVFIKMLENQVCCTVWYCVDNAATSLKLEEKKKAEPHLAWTWNHCRVYKQNPTELAAGQAAIKNMNPQDAMEAMLVSQAIGVYFASIECLNNASWENDNIESRTAYLNAASKLSRTFAELSKALDRHRGKGVTEQKIIVQYVNVEGGAQAVIGSNVTPQGRGTEKIAE